MFESIVVAFDGSPHSNKALEIGATLAAHEKIPLGIIYVIDDSHREIPEEIRRMSEIEHIIEPTPQYVVNLAAAPVTLVSTMNQVSADSEKALFHYAEFLVQQAQENAVQMGAGEVESKSVIGDPAEEIVAFARDRNADLIVTGSRGFGKLKSALLGSTSNKVSHLADCSCLTVK